MPNYKILLDGEHVFAKLRRATGETLQAAKGDIVELFEGHFDPDIEHEAGTVEAEAKAHAQVIEDHIKAGTIEATDEAADEWPKVVAAVTDEEKAALAQTEKLKADALAEQAKIEAQAKADALAAIQKAGNPPAGPPAADPVDPPAAQ